MEISPPFSWERYQRQTLLPEFGLDGQERLRESSVFVIGSGGLGNPALLYLAAAGVGHLRVAEPDRVEISNLQRQILYRDRDQGEPKAQRTRQYLQELNPEIEIEVTDEPFREANGESLARGTQILIDASDNFATRKIANQISLRHRIPLVQGSLFRWEGQIAVFSGAGGPCYECLFPELPERPNCAEAGVLGALAGIVGSYQAFEALRILVGFGRSSFGQLIRFHGLTNQWRRLTIAAEPECPRCAEVASRHQEREMFFRSRSESQLTPKEVVELIKSDPQVTLLDVREPSERALASLGGLFIPLGELKLRWEELPKDRPIIVYCHHGVRSLQAVGMLKHAGLTDVRNLKGGIDLWSLEVDPQVPRY